MKYDLDLKSLTHLSDNAAENLSKHVGKLSLFMNFEDGIVDMSESAAQSLLKHDGLIDIPGPDIFSESVFAILKKHPSLVDAEW